VQQTQRETERDKVGSPISNVDKTQLTEHPPQAASSKAAQNAGGTVDVDVSLMIIEQLSFYFQTLNSRVDPTQHSLNPQNK
jgi:hypothetical protein